MSKKSMTTAQLHKYLQDNKEEIFSDEIRRRKQVEDFKKLVNTPLAELEEMIKLREEKK